MNDAALLSRFENGELPMEEWHHREHVRLAYLYLLRLPYAEALDRLRHGLQTLNAAHRVPETLDRGYHETLTQGWMRLVHSALSEYGPAGTSEIFVDEHSHLLARRALYFFYSRPRLRSAEAKARFIEPDLAPLPTIRTPFQPDPVMPPSESWRPPETPGPPGHPEGRGTGIQEGQAQTHQEL